MFKEKERKEKKEEVGRGKCKKEKAGMVS